MVSLLWNMFFCKFIFGKLSTVVQYYFFSSLRPNFNFLKNIFWSKKKNTYWTISCSTTVRSHYCLWTFFWTPKTIFPKKEIKEKMFFIVFSLLLYVLHTLIPIQHNMHSTQAHQYSESSGFWLLSPHFYFSPICIHLHTVYLLCFFIWFPIQ